MSPLIVIGNIILLLAAIPAVLFVIFYTHVQWEKTQIGRQTMALSFAVATILCLTVFRVFVGPSEIYGVIRLVAFSSMVPILWWRFALLIRAQTGTQRYHADMEPTLPPDQHPDSTAEGHLSTVDQDEMDAALPTVHLEGQGDPE